MKRISWIISVLTALVGIVLAVIAFVLVFLSMKVETFINLVSTMRKHQKAYYRDRKPSELIASKQFEKQVDQALKDGIAIPVEAVLDTRPEDAEPGEQIGLFE